MSQENVERTRRTHEAFNRRDLDAFLALCDPEMEFTSRVARLAGDPHYRGHEGLAAGCDQLGGQKSERG